MNTINEVMNKVQEVADKANVELAFVIRGGFPFTMEEVKINVACDSAGIYVTSGNTPVTSLSRYGDPAAVVAEVEDALRDVMDEIRAAVERRGTLRDQMEDLKKEDATHTQAESALLAAGCNADEILGFSKESTKPIVDAAKKAVQAANTNPFVGVLPYKEYKMVVKEFATGLAVMASGKPVMITKYPRISNNKTIDKMVKFIEVDIANIAASRRRYFRKVRDAKDLAERLHGIAAEQDRIERRMAACS